MIFTDMGLLDQGMRSNNKGMALAMMSMDVGSTQRLVEGEDGEVRGKNEPEQAQMRRVVSLPVEEIVSLEEYSSTEEVKIP